MNIFLILDDPKIVYPNLEKCVELGYFWSNTVAALITDRCVVAFSAEKCDRSSKLYRFPPGRYYDLRLYKVEDKIVSVQDCDVYDNKVAVMSADYAI